MSGIKKNTIMESDDLRRELVQYGPTFVMAWLCDDPWTISTETDNACALLGMKAMKGRAFKKLIHQDDLAQFEEMIDFYLAKHSQTFNHNFRVVGDAGKTRWLSGVVKIVYGDNDDVVLFEGIFTDLSFSKETEEILIRSIKAWKEIFDSMSACILVVDKNAKLINMNQSAKRFFGRDIELGMPLVQLFKDLDNELVEALVNESRECESCVSFKSYWLDVRIFPVTRHEDDEHQKVITIYDITEYRNLSILLRNERNFAKSLVDTAPAAIVVLDAEGKFVDYNHFMEELSERKIEETRGERFVDVLVPEVERIEYETLVCEVVAGERHMKGSMPFVTQSGKLLAVEWSDTILSDDGGEFAGLLMIGRDVTQQVAVEKELIRNLNFNRSLVDSIPNPVFFKDPEGVYLGCNRAFQLFMGKPVSDIVGKTVYDLAPKELADLYWEKDCILFKRGGTQIYEEKVIRSDGAERFIVFHKSVFRDELEKMAGIVGVMLDMTERKRSEQALMDSEELHRVTLGAISDAVFITNDEGEFVYIGPTVDIIFGFTSEEAWRKKNISTLIGLDVYDPDELARKGEITNIERRILDKNHVAHILLINVKKVFVKGGTILYTCRDITALRLSEERARCDRERLTHSEKMATLGTLVSGVGHEINNPNTFIMLNAPMMRKMWEETLKPLLLEKMEDEGDDPMFQKTLKRMPQMIDGIENGAERIRNIVKDLKDFARQDTDLTMNLVDLNDVVRASVTLVGNKIKRSTDYFTCSTGTSLPPIQGNYQRLEQVVINLLINACDALESKKAAITIGTKYDDAEKKVMVEIVDEGVGISESDLRRVMDPFFTTKRDYGGTGLGLSISQGIVAEHDGEIIFDSIVGKGTTVRLEFPVKQDI